VSLLQSKTVYKPFTYPEAVEFWRKHERAHWIINEIPLDEDVKDWNDKLNDKEKLLCSTIFRFFTQGDILVFDAYADKFVPVFKNPEVKRMMGSFSGRETVHIDAYAKLIETLGMPDEEFSEFLKVKQMTNKVDYLTSFNPHKTIEQYAEEEWDGFEYEKRIELGTIKWKCDVAKTLAVYSAFTEGMHLFSSFALLLNFNRFNKMKGMGTVIEWSVRDELMHCEGMTWLFRQFIKENPEIWTDSFKKEIYQICREMVKLEDAFIDLVFKEVEIEGLTKEEMKKYIRFIADRRLADLGLKANYHIKENPLPWMAWMLMDSHTNFFERRNTAYSKGGDQDWDEAF
jgi:ribonucleoside-diphosphate reductase beta chain